MEMSLTRALAEIKMLDKRIEKEVGDFRPMDIAVGGKLRSGMSKEEYVKQVESTFQRINDLMARRIAIKGRLVEANAKTRVRVGGVEMSIAEALERKKFVESGRRVVKGLRHIWGVTRTEVDKINREVQSRLDEHLKGMFGKDRRVEGEDYARVANPFLKSNEAEVVDPIELASTTWKLEATIDDFENQVDIALSEINATTFIDVPE